MAVFTHLHLFILNILKMELFNCMAKYSIQSSCELYSYDVYGYFCTKLETKDLRNELREHKNVSFDNLVQPFE